MNRSIVSSALLLLCIAGCGDDDATGPDASTSGAEDAGAQDAGGQDAGSQDAGDQDASDAAALGGDTGTSETCDSLACWCDEFCGKVEVVDCAKDVPLAQCKMDCAAPDTSGCSAEQLAFVACQAQKAQLQYHCDPDFETWTLDGCDTEGEAFVTCIMTAE